MEKNDKKIIRAWCMYDWANSAYSLVITSTIFPVYFSTTAVNAAVSSDSPDYQVVNFLGMELRNSVLFTLAISFSFLIISFINPFLTALADYGGNKKRYMQFFCYLGAVSCGLLYFFTAETLTFSVFAFMAATIGYSGSIVFYNAYLPEIATEDRTDAVSAKGFSLGYIGSVLLLLFNLSMMMKPEWYGNVSAGKAARIAFLSTGIWWVLFAQFAFFRLKDTPKKHRGENSKNNLFNGFRELKKVLSELKELKLLKRFLVSFFFYNMGVQTVMYVAAIFGEKELQMPGDKLILTVLIIQLVAIVGASGFSKLSSKVGNTRALAAAVTVWIGICGGAYFVYGASGFYILAAFVGFVMGGIQALSRSTYSKLIPDATQDHASYFSFYDVADKVSLCLGTLSYALIEHITGNMRNSVLALAVFFIIGLIFLIQIPSKKIYADNKVYTDSEAKN